LAIQTATDTSSLNKNVNLKASTDARKIVNKCQDLQACNATIRLYTLVSFVNRQFATQKCLWRNEKTYKREITHLFNTKPYREIKIIKQY
jgi:topoisomerase IA-like protein